MVIGRYNGQTEAGGQMMKGEPVTNEDKAASAAARRDDGGPAFPFRSEVVLQLGMTLRDWFAGQAIVPWNAVIETLSLKGEQYPTAGRAAEYRAKLKYLEADAMLAERRSA